MSDSCVHTKQMECFACGVMNNVPKCDCKAKDISLTLCRDALKLRCNSCDVKEACDCQQENFCLTFKALKSVNDILGKEKENEDEN